MTDCRESRPGTLSSSSGGLGGLVRRGAPLTRPLLWPRRHSGRDVRGPAGPGPSPTFAKGTTLSTAFLVGPDVGGARDGDATSIHSQLRELGLLVVGPGREQGLATAISAAPPGKVALVDRRLVAHTHAVRLALLDPRVGTGVTPGLLSVDAADRPALEAAVRALESATAAAATAAGVPVSLTPGEVAARMGADVDVVPIDVSPLVCAVAHDQDELAALRAARTTVEEEPVRLRQSVKTRDGFFATYLVSPYSRHIARWCARRNLTPNQVTAASIVVALLAAALCTTGDRPAYVLAAVLLQASFVLDCVDGQLARYSLLFSRRGGWLDATADRVKEYVVFAGLAVGAARDGDPVWALAAVALAFQTVRHFLHFGYSETVGAGPPVTNAATPGRETGWSVWLRRAAVLPIGERWLLISVVMALSTPRAVFVVLLLTGSFAFTYAALGRVRRSVLRWGGLDGSADAVLRPMLDLGPVARLGARLVPGRVPAPALGLLAAAPLAVVLVLPGTGRAWWLVAGVWYALMVGGAGRRPLVGRLDWMLAPLVRTTELFGVLGVLAGLDSPGSVAGFAFLAASAYHHYDVVYRLRATQRAGGSSSAAVVGHEGRLLVVVLVAWVSPAAVIPVLLVMAVLLSLLNLLTGLRWWLAPDALGSCEELGETRTTTGDTL